MAAAEAERAIANTYMINMQQQQQQDLPTDFMCSGGGGGDLFDHIDDLLPVFPNDDALDFITSDDATAGLLLDGDQHYLHFSGGSDGGAPPVNVHHHQQQQQHQEDQCLHGLALAIPSDNKDEVSNHKTTSEHRLFEDIADLEWLSSFMDESSDSYSLGLFPSQDHDFQTLSPVSVLEPNAKSGASSSCSSTTGTGGGGGSSSNSSSGTSTAIASPDPISVVPARARSKRPRPAAFSPRLHVTIPFLPCRFPLPPPPESFGESAIPAATPLKFKIKKNKEPAAASGGCGGGEVVAGSARKCMHCQIQKTPQWRAGPMGPKTLCNACGVRYKSGRLFPEYRPAASPTFVPSLHSNSHKKVVEMRINNTTSGMQQSCELLDYIRLRPNPRG